TYTLAFFDCVNPLLPTSCNNIGTTPVNQAAFTASGVNPSTGVTGGVVAKSGGLGTVGMSITNVRVYPGDNTFDQNLPLDPNGIVYSSGPSRNPVAGAVVRLIGPGGSDPSALLLGNSNTVVTGVNGFYQFFFVNATAANNGTYTLTVQAPPGYSPPLVTSTTFATGGGVAAPGSLSPVPPGATNAQPQATPPVVGGNTTYYLNFRYNFTPGLAGEVFNNHIPLDPAGVPGGGPIGTVADVSVVKTGPATLAGGFTGTYTITITNAGPGAATNVRVEDILPDGLTLVSASITPAASWNLGTGTMGAVAEAANLAVGSSTLTLVVQASAAAVGTTITNVASVTTTSTDTNPSNNTSRASTLIVGADVSIVKTGPATVATGTTISYVLTLVNAGPSVATNVTVTDILPTGLSLVSATVVSGSFTLVTSATGVTALAGSMPVGTAVVALTAEVGVGVVGTITNVANITSTMPDIRPANNSSTATSVVLGADLSIMKFGPPSISAAGTATYTLVVANNGPSVALNVTVTDVLPMGLSLVSSGVVPLGSATFNNSSGTLTAVLSAMRLGTTTITLTVQADYTATGVVTNYGRVTSTTPDMTPSNNVGSVTSSIREVEPGVILVNKTGNKTVAEVGDSVQYTIRMRNTIGLPVQKVVLEDLLPAGFRYILGTSRINGATAPDPAGGVGRQLNFDIGTIAGNTVVELTYFVRLGVGSQQGDGINRATAVFPGARGTPVRSNTAMFKVTVQGGVFTNEGCIVGKVYVDCDGNAVQSRDNGPNELGIPNVRLVMLDGSYVITDNEGKYSLCGVKPQTQVIKVDTATLPKGSRLVPSSNRNAGVATSIFVDMKAGEMHRADFIEGSCTPEVMEQVKARRNLTAPVMPEAERLMQQFAPTGASSIGVPAPSRPLQ
ncbi:MAG: DUF11 domain-containing protein, partial [Burkholderiales bacterium]